MNKQQCLRVCVSLILLMITAAPAFARVWEPVRTTLCAIIENPRKYNGKAVQFDAYFESDGLENSGLRDEAHCKWSMALSWPEKVPGEEGLDKALFRGSPGTLDKVIFAEWTGVFHYFPKKIPESVLRVRAIKNVRSMCEDCPELHEPIRLPNPPAPRLPPA